MGRAGLLKATIPPYEPAGRAVEHSAGGGDVCILTEDSMDPNEDEDMREMPEEEVFAGIVKLDARQRDALERLLDNPPAPTPDLIRMMRERRR